MAKPALDSFQTLFLNCYTVATFQKKKRKKKEERSILNADVPSLTIIFLFEYERGKSADI